MRFASFRSRPPGFERRESDRSLAAAFFLPPVLFRNARFNGPLFCLSLPVKRPRRSGSGSGGLAEQRHREQGARRRAHDDGGKKKKVFGKPERKERASPTEDAPDERSRKKKNSRTGSAHDDGGPARGDDARRRRSSSGARGRPGEGFRGLVLETRLVSKKTEGSDAKALALFSTTTKETASRSCAVQRAFSKVPNAAAEAVRSKSALLDWREPNSASGEGAREDVEKREKKKEQRKEEEERKSSKNKSLTSRTRGAPRRPRPTRRRHGRTTRTASGSPSCGCRELARRERGGKRDEEAREELKTNEKSDFLPSKRQNKPRRPKKFSSQIRTSACRLLSLSLSLFPISSS